MDSRQACATSKMDVRNARRTFRKIGLFFFLFSALALDMQLFFGAFLQTFFPSLLTEAEGVFVFIIIIPLYVISFPAAFLLLNTLPATKPISATLRVGHFFRFLFMCYPIAFLGGLIGQFVQFIATRWGSFLHIDLTLSLTGLTLNDLLSGSPFFLNVLVICIMAPLFEEFLFRKFLIDRIKKYGDKVAIITSGLFFGLFHGNFSQFFFATMLGMLFAYIYCKTGRIRYSIALHMIINTTSTIVSTIVLHYQTLHSRDNVSLSDNYSFLSFIALYAILGLAAIITGSVFLIKYLRRFIYDEGTTPIPRGKAFYVVWLNIGTILFMLSCVFMFASSVL